MTRSTPANQQQLHKRVLYCQRSSVKAQDVTAQRKGAEGKYLQSLVGLGSHDLVRVCCNIISHIHPLHRSKTTNEVYV